MAIESKGNFEINADEQNIPSIINIPNYPKVDVQKNQIETTQKILKILKICMIPFALVQLLYILPRAYPLLINIIFPALGFFGVTRLSSYIIKIFSVYIVILCICQMILMGLLKGTAFIVLQTFVLVFELFVLYISFKAFMSIESLSESDFNLLKS